VTLTIHQPNFFPWYPFFLKMAAADVMVLLNHAQFPKGKYVTRFGLNGQWYTMPTRRGLVDIADKRYLSPSRDWPRLKSRLPAFKPILDLFDDQIGESVADTNGKMIRRIARILGIATAVMDDYPTALRGTPRLVDICKRHGANVYVSGPSGPDYLDPLEFEREGIEVVTMDAEKEDKIAIIEVLRDGSRLAAGIRSADLKQVGRADALLNTAPHEELNRSENMARVSAATVRERSDRTNTAP